MTIQIAKPEVEALIKRRLETGAFKDAEDVFLQALRSSEAERGNEEARRGAIERLLTFGKTHGLSLGGMTIRELRPDNGYFRAKVAQQKLIGTSGLKCLQS